MVSITTTQLCHCSVKEARDNLSLGLTTADYKTGLAVACPGVEELGNRKNRDHLLSPNPVPGNIIPYPCPTQILLPMHLNFISSNLTCKHTSLSL